ncbi:MAG TPA: MAPEG family protein [Sphingobium sp.]
MQIGILWPTFVLVGLVYVVWLLMIFQRFRHMKASPPQKQDFETGEAALRYFTPVEMPANNLRNLFEMPVLYFALVPLLLITRHANHVEVALAWTFVLLRVVHSIIHATSGPVMSRFLVYALSCAVLSAMWIGFAVDLALGR